MDPDLDPGSSFPLFSDIKYRILPKRLCMNVHEFLGRGIENMYRLGSSGSKQSMHI